MPAAISPRLALSYGWSDGEDAWGAPTNVDWLTLDAIVCVLLQSTTTATPPASPSPGMTYFVPVNPTGAWSGQAGKIACYQQGAWNFYMTPMGMRARVVDNSSFQWWDGGSWALENAALSANINIVPAAFLITGKPATGAIYNVVMSTPLTLPANFAGTQLYDATQATANTIITVRKISGGTTTTTIGTITVLPSGKQTFMASTQAAVPFVAGDVLQLLFPTQDATLADLSISFPLVRS